MLGSLRIYYAIYKNKQVICFEILQTWWKILFIPMQILQRTPTTSYNTYSLILYRILFYFFFCWPVLLLLLLICAASTKHSDTQTNFMLVSWVSQTNNNMFTSIKHFKFFYNWIIYWMMVKIESEEAREKKKWQKQKNKSKWQL